VQTDVAPAFFASIVCVAWGVQTDNGNLRHTRNSHHTRQKQNEPHENKPTRRLLCCRPAMKHHSTASSPCPHSLQPDARAIPGCRKTKRPSRPPTHSTEQRTSSKALRSCGRAREKRTPSPPQAPPPGRAPLSRETALARGGPSLPMRASTAASRAARTGRPARRTRQTYSLAGRPSRP